jgi:Bacteriocin-protection, YdeI or OmpD-Associated
MRRLSIHATGDEYAAGVDDGSDPPELTALLADAALRRAWSSVPWTMQREYCRWVSAGRTSFTRRKRARSAIREAAEEADRSW